MGELLKDFHTLALEYAISVANSLDFSDAPLEHKIAARTNLIRLLVSTLQMQRGTTMITAEEVKKIIDIETKPE